MMLYLVRRFSRRICPWRTGGLWWLINGYLWLQSTWKGIFKRPMEGQCKSLDHLNFLNQKDSIWFSCRFWSWKETTKTHFRFFSVDILTIIPYKDPDISLRISDFPGYSGYRGWVPGTPTILWTIKRCLDSYRLTASWWFQWKILVKLDHFPK